ncbi:MAG: glycerol-3-phosphate dehydrogenase/oxidase [Gammaproteobacteria bacterium]|jgi:glycerol-3-phosphate dehydrogenase
MSTEHFDIVVIGAGIHGAGIAQAAACYGFRVLVLEKQGIASGTSSRSSKLIHGGLRYLETAQFALVRECLHERDLLLRLAPELVRIRPFCIPVYRNSSRSVAKIAAGLSLYALLGGARKISRFKTIPRAYWDQLDGLSTDHLRTVFQYSDAQTDDKELTKAVLQSAIQLGAELRMPAHFSAAEISKICEVQFIENGKQQTCSAKVLINAAGPWVAEVLANITPKQAPVPVDFVQGTHIVLKTHMGERVYYLEAPQDQRAVFVIPWKNHAMVGTTETLFRNSPEQVKPLASEVDYLLNTFMHYFPAIQPQSNNIKHTVIDQFAGLRVLPVSTTSAFRRPRDTIIQLDNISSPKVASLYGGKLTAYRATADKVMQQLLPALPRKKPVANTEDIKLVPVE